MSAGVIAGRLTLNERNYRGRTVSSRACGDDLNTYVDWAVNDKLLISIAYAVFFPDAAATQGIGDDATWHIVEMGTWLSF